MLRITGSMRQLAIRRAKAALGGHASQVESLLVNLEPERSGDGSETRRCVVSARTVMGEVRVEATGVDVYAALQGALSKLSRVLGSLAQRPAA